MGTGSSAYDSTQDFLNKVGADPYSKALSNSVFGSLYGDSSRWRNPGYYPNYSGELPGQTMGYAGNQVAPGAVGYTPFDQAQYSNLFSQAQGKATNPYLYAKHSGVGNKISDWKTWWTQNMAQAMGYGNYTPTDPLARLQEQLMNEYNPDYLPGQDRQYMSSVVNERNNSIMRMLQQREAATGTKGLYGGVQNEMDAVRQTLVDQAMAEYDPMRWETKQKAEEETMMLMQAINEAEAMQNMIIGEQGVSTGAPKEAQSG